MSDRERMTPERRNEKLVKILMDLHRCEHGRLEPDPCYGCEGKSEGNKLLPPGTVIGHTLYGHEIVVPAWEDHYDPDAWVRRRT